VGLSPDDDRLRAIARGANQVAAVPSEEAARHSTPHLRDRTMQLAIQRCLV
jgi:hypothetical protein